MRILVLCFSQTGQLRDVTGALLEAAQEEGHEVVWASLATESDYPFPWPVREFFGVFPDTVLGRPPALKPVETDTDESFDLIVLSYQVWYLAPSLPVQAFLDSPWASVLRDVPVLGVTACRNMWYSAALDLNARVEALGGRMVGTVAVVDDAPAWATFVTTPRWLVTGKRNRLLKIFPPAGISEDRLATVRELGGRLAMALPASGTVQRGVLDGADAYRVDPPILVLDRVGHHVFAVWAGAIGSAERLGAVARAIALMAFVVFLLLGILVSLPLTLIAAVVGRPLMRRYAGHYSTRLDAATA